MPENLLIIRENIQKLILMVTGQRIVIIKTAGVSWYIHQSKHLREKLRQERLHSVGTAVTVSARVAVEPVPIMVASVAGAEVVLQDERKNRNVPIRRKNGIGLPVPATVLI